MSYKHNKTWRIRHPDTRYKGKKRYYDRTAFAKNGGAKWQEWEIELVLSHEMTDMELAKELGRSVSAIQKRRCKSKQQKGMTE